jgi:hypothetical protein
MPDGALHAAQTGANLHVALRYIAASDPYVAGVTKAYDLWADTSGGSGKWILKVRNAANGAWETTATDISLKVTGAASVTPGNLAVFGADGYTIADGGGVPVGGCVLDLQVDGGILVEGSAGDARGVYAVDLQTARASVGQVASGDYATIGGGDGNTASAYASTVGGGWFNTASGNNSFVGGGWFNTASEDYATVGGGDTNTASEDYATVGGGYGNTASGYYSTVGGGSGNDASGRSATVAGGYDNTASAYASTVGGGGVNTASGTYGTVGGGGVNTASAYFSTVGGGRVNTASGNYSTVPGGQLAVADKYGQSSHAAGQFAAAGDAQTSVLVARISTVDNTPAELFLDGSAARCTIASDTTWAFSILVVARRTDADNESAAYKFEGCIDNNAGTTALVGSVTKTVLAEDTAGWDCNVTADNANDALVITATGENAKIIYWVARIELVEVTG